MEYLELLENNIRNNPVFKIISETADELNYSVWVVGGYVRDVLLGRDCKDIDVVCLGSGIKLAQAVAQKIGNPTVSVFKNFGTAMFHWNEWEVEFVGARKESYRSDSRKPSVEDGTLSDDQNRRDFTINALAFSLNQKDFGSLIDSFGGISDLEKRIIRTPLEPEKTFSDDPLRMMRAIRFSAQLQFDIEEKTLEAISAMSSRIDIISKERITEEFSKILASEKPSIGLNLLFHTGLLEKVFPQLVLLKGVEEVDGVKHKDNLEHTFLVVDNVAKKSDNLWLRWAALLHDIGKPATKKFDKQFGWTFHGHDAVGSKMITDLFRKLKLPLNEKMKFVKKMVFLHLRPIALTQDDITDSAVRRLLVEAGEHIEDLLILCEADITSKNPEKVKRFIKNLELLKEKIALVEESDRLRNWQPPITGEIIMSTFGLQPSREVGELKKAIREAILNGEVKDDYNEAFKFLLKIAASYNLYPKKD